MLSDGVCVGIRVGVFDLEGLELAVTLGLKETDGNSEMDGNCEGGDVG